MRLLLTIASKFNHEVMVMDGKVVDEIFEIYETRGRETFFGESISQLEHMSQTAQLAMLERFDDEVIIACFFHDIGNLCVSITKENSLGTYGIQHHEKIGADFLREKGFPERVAELVENHVQAKRYLTFKYPEYYDQLSDAGKATLILQGGIMNEFEAAEFEGYPLFMLSIMMRKWDDMAKENDVPLVDLNELKQIASDILIKSNKTAFIKSQELLNSI